MNTQFLKASGEIPPKGRGRVMHPFRELLRRAAPAGNARNRGLGGSAASGASAKAPAGSSGKWGSDSLPTDARG
jgi:hypothetical protein